MPDIVLDVIVDIPATDTGISTLQVQQLDSLPVLPPTYESTLKAGIASSWIVPTTSSTFSAPPAATSSARSTSINYPDETLMANLSLFNGPHASPPVRHQQAVLDGQPPTTENLPAPSHPNSDNEAQQPAVQSASADSSPEMEWAHVMVSACFADKYTQVGLGDMYRDGKGFEQDYQAAMEWYLKAAAQGHAEAQYNIGKLYYYGQGVRRDYAQAMDWCLMAANQGHVHSQNKVGYLYDNGEGVPQDYAQAMAWYLKAAEQGHAPSQYNIGCLYDDGDGVPKDHAKAMEWYHKAAQQGHVGSQFSIAILYCYGDGIPHDYAQAMEWYLKAAQQGHV
ncbi:hypothetical protein BGZ91_006313, partial [Linnemannia elongata]